MHRAIEVPLLHPVATASDASNLRLPPILKGLPTGLVRVESSLQPRQPFAPLWAFPWCWTGINSTSSANEAMLGLSLTGLLSRACGWSHLKRPWQRWVLLTWWKRCFRWEHKPLQAKLVGSDRLGPKLTGQQQRLTPHARPVTGSSVAGSKQLQVEQFCSPTLNYSTKPDLFSFSLIFTPLRWKRGSRRRLEDGWKASPCCCVDPTRWSIS